MPTLYFFAYFFPFFIMIILVVFLLIKKPDYILSRRITIVLFFVGLFLAPVVTGHLFYPANPYLGVGSYLNYLIVYLIIPSLIATAILTKENSVRRNASTFFIILLVFESFSLLYKLPFGHHLPKNPAIKLEIARDTMVLGDLLHYSIAVAVPALFCYPYTKTRSAFLRILLILAIPVSLTLAYIGIMYLTGGVM
ncbi:hypothetical protein Asulf_02039 [Archaeoglobus sulfaticallidus PM70-1]|uniref:Uncharacterized protein n=1 Tax=Archaeoglobus sulfaticallidus PM70-1 TaxID=387631 RepID=N0BIA2_9EURY|nr:hypothetical protein [Archaeoglobus sulfaticallidus]AGK62002.1 hypothetical protein Asulf_02039 [Archaeoglobus sulfaticallidus PM70-1]